MTDPTPPWSATIATMDTPPVYQSPGWRRWTGDPKLCCPSHHLPVKWLRRRTDGQWDLRCDKPRELEYLNL